MIHSNSFMYFRYLKCVYTWYWMPQKPCINGYYFCVVKMEELFAIAVFLRSWSTRFFVNSLTFRCAHFEQGWLKSIKECIKSYEKSWCYLSDMYEYLYEKWVHFMKYNIIFDGRLWATFAQFWWFGGTTVGGEVENTGKKHRIACARNSRIRNRKCAFTSAKLVNLRGSNKSFASRVRNFARLAFAIS